MEHKSSTSLIELNKKTAIKSALLLNVFIFIVQVVILIYGYSLGENVSRKFIEEINLLGRYDNTYFFIIKYTTFFLVNTFLLYFFFLIDFWIIKNYLTNKRKVLLVIVIMFLFIGVLSTGISQILGIWFKGNLSAYHYSVIHFAKDLLLFIVSIFVSNTLFLLNNNHQKIEENKNLTIENFKNRYEALKNKTDPHFLFNSLNSLSGLIGADDARAQEYLIQLSTVFRYTMQDYDIVTLTDELHFTQSYIYLMKIRYGEAFSVNINIPEKYNDYYILPIAIQTLVENSVKHNEVSLRKPLTISIDIKDSDMLVVENNLQPKKDSVHGSELGLSNLNERYMLMFNQNINIIVDETSFKVEIPLIKYYQKRSSVLK